MIDRAIFSLPIGRMSQILDDGRSPTMSIVRVIERTEAGRQPFTEVQAEIKEKLKNAHNDKDKQKLHDYVEKLRAETPIWTIYDDEPKEATAGSAAPAAAATGQPPATTTMRPTDPAASKKMPVNPYLR